MAHHPYQKVVERDFQCVVGADPSDDAVKPRAIQVSQAVIPDEERFWSAFVSAKRLADIPDPLRIRGHFTLAAIGHGCARLVTDAGGMVPVFYARAGSGFVVGTRLNEVARAVGAPVDITSVYDFLCNGAVCHPYTWFDGVRVCDPASFILFEGAQVTQEPYWHPAYNSSLSIEEAGAKLRGALEEAITDSAIRKTVALLYSGGEDSRVVAALTEAERLGFIILPVKNREFVLAKLSARLLGFDVKRIPIKKDHYRQQLRHKQDLVGFGFDLAHAHVYGCETKLPATVVLGGWGADTLFKGLYQRRKQGRPLVGLRCSTWNNSLPAHAFRVLERRQARLETLRAMIPEAAYEWDRFWPLSAHPHYAHFATSRRLLEMREPFLASQMVRLAAEISAEQRAGGNLFRLAFGKKLGGAGYVPRSDGRVPRLSSAENLRVKPVVDAAFWLHEHVVHRRVDQGPWLRPSFAKLPLQQVLEGLRVLDGGRLSDWLSVASSSYQLRNRVYQLHEAVCSKRSSMKTGS